MSNFISKLKDDTHFRVLHLLQNNPEMSQRELAKAAGVSASSIHYALYALIEKGLIKLGHFTASKDKRRYVNISTPKGIAQKTKLTRAFLTRKIEEYEALKVEIDILNAELKPKPASRPLDIACRD